MNDNYVFSPENEAEGIHGRMDPYLRAEQLYQDIVNARTILRLKSELTMKRQSTMMRTCSSFKHQWVHSKEEHLVIGPGDSGGLLTRTEFELAKFVQKKN
jgi:hypothetical protein